MYKTTNIRHIATTHYGEKHLLKCSIQSTHLNAKIYKYLNQISNRHFEHPIIHNPPSSFCCSQHIVKCVGLFSQYSACYYAMRLLISRLQIHMDITIPSSWNMAIPTATPIIRPTWVLILSFRLL